MLASLAVVQSAGPDSAWAAAIARLKPQSTIRIRQIGAGRIEGEFVRGSGATLVLAGTPALVEHSTAALDSLWARGNSTKTGAIVGGAVGFVAGAGFGYMANEVGCKDDSGDPCPEAIPLIGLIGAAGGTLLGALIGSAIPKWHRRIP